MWCCGYGVVCGSVVRCVCVVVCCVYGGVSSVCCGVVCVFVCACYTVQLVSCVCVLMAEALLSIDRLS